MLILAMDTTATAATVALVTETSVLAEFMTNHKRNHSETLMPLISDMLKSVEVTLTDVDYIAFSSGPGSFTGLRIGGATAKGLAAGVQKPVIAVPTLLALAYNIYISDRLIVPIMDARRGQVYTAVYEQTDSGLNRLTDYLACDINELFSKIDRFGRDAIFTGDGVKTYYEHIRRAGYDAAPLNMQLQRAASVGAAAVTLAQNGQAQNPADVTLLYLRKPQAERERELYANESGK